MRNPRPSLLFFLGLASSLVPIPNAGAAAPPLPHVVDFNRDIRPILSDNCYQCHGPDRNQRKAHLRLDTRDGLFSSHEGIRVVVPGKPADSEIYQRIVCEDKNERMPAPKSGKTLTERQIGLIKKWIEQGAEWKGHWAYIRPERPQVPTGFETEFVRNPIDQFVLARLKEAELRPSAEADRVTLIRRLYFDLIGLPPTPAEVDAFVHDPRPDAEELLVDHLLSAPEYGERMAMVWLDLVRYADSIGYHSDNPMQVSPYRDYVIKAFNDNKPFDRFTIEQLAGDLLPQATLEQKVASTYNRLLQTTEEGGAQAKEYEAKYAADRVRNVSTVWLGATMGCCQCHDHKFDPYTTKDFYRLAAYFADIQEAAVGRREAGMAVPSARQAAQLKKLVDALAGLKQRLDTATPELIAAQARWEIEQRAPTQWHVLDPVKLTAASGTKLSKQPGGIVRASGKTPDKETYTITAKTELKGITAIRLEALEDAALPAHGPGASSNGNFVLTEFKVSAASGTKAAAPVVLKKASADFSQEQFAVANAIDGKNDTGWAILPAVGKQHTAIFLAAIPVGTKAEATLIFILDHQSIYPKHNIGKFRLSVTTDPDPKDNLSLPDSVRTTLALPPAKRSEHQARELAAFYRAIAPILQPIRDRIASLEAQKTDLLKTVPTTLVTISGSPRTVRVLPRGNWLDESGQVVSPAVPEFLHHPAASEGRATRLDLARWIVARENPLTARAFMNRLWKLYFGQGLSKTLDDLGAQGEWPTHPELLDWLAVEFMDSGWDIKHMVRLLVTCGSYRQTSQPRAELKEHDPYNRLIGRQARYRLDAEIVRDNALAISGLLSNRIGGPSVKPYQPAGYWEALNFPPREWQNDKGTSLYRRGLYTHWQRTFLQPSLLAFDAPSREECTVERARSNIPQQALALLNDPTYVEVARVFAEHILKEGGSSVSDRVRWAYRRALSRPPKDEELHVLEKVYAKHCKDYASDKASALKLLSTGAQSVCKDADVVELAAWTSVARVILNLHETITRN